MILMVTCGWASWIKSFEASVMVLAWEGVVCGVSSAMNEPRTEAVGGDAAVVVVVMGVRGGEWKVVGRMKAAAAALVVERGERGGDAVGEPRGGGRKAELHRYSTK
ncbi:hypothetical protein Droror1_Dr00003566 [Drosera rotundifolia]